MTTTALFAASASPSDFTGLVGWVVDVVATGGPVGVAFLLALDQGFGIAHRREGDRVLLFRRP